MYPAADDDLRYGGLEPFRWKKRVFLVFAPSEADLRYTRQLEQYNRSKAKFEERSFVIIGVLGSQREHLRREFRVAPHSFIAILVGKDGNEKSRWHDPVAEGELLRVIDAMPLRQREAAANRG